MFEPTSMYVVFWSLPSVSIGIRTPVRTLVPSTSRSFASTEKTYGMLEIFLSPSYSAKTSCILTGIDGVGLPLCCPRKGGSIRLNTPIKGRESYFFIELLRKYSNAALRLHHGKSLPVAFR